MKIEKAGETTGIEETQLFDVEIPRVDLVTLPATRRKWAVRKSEDSTPVVANISEMEGGMAEVKKEDLPVTETAKAEVSIEKALEVLKAAEKLPAGVLKALADLLDANKKPEDELMKPPVQKSEELVAVEKENLVLKDRLVALEKGLRVKELEPLCKGLSLDVEVVWKAEQVDKESAKYFLAKLDEADKRIRELMKESGSTGAVEQTNEDPFMAEVERVVKSEKMNIADAQVLVATNKPELYREHTRMRQAATKA